MVATSNAPVLFLVFNRPDLAQRVFAQIREARPTRLFIAADGPRADRPDDVQACRECRELAAQVDWPCEVKTLFREQNLGCGAAVGSAITWFFDNVEAGIILEDDCLPDPSFFPFCAELLARYKDEERVMSISGDCFFPDDIFSPHSYVFSIYVHVWGWATWRRAWGKYNPGMHGFKEAGERNELISWLGSKAAADYWTDIMRRFRAGEIDSWAYPWLFSCWQHHGMSIVPEVNLVSNIGSDSRGTHVGGKPSSTVGRPLTPMNFPLRHPQEMVRNAALERKTESLYHSSVVAAQSVWKRWAITLLRRIAFGEQE